MLGTEPASSTQPLSLYIADPSIDPHSPARGLENIKIRDAIKRHFSFFFFFLFAFDTRFKFILGRASSIKAKVFMVMKRPSRELTAWLFNFSTESSISFLFFSPFSRLFLFSRVYNIILYRRIVGVCSPLVSTPRKRLTVLLEEFSRNVSSRSREEMEGKDRERLFDCYDAPHRWPRWHRRVRSIKPRSVSIRHVWVKLYGSEWGPLCRGSPFSTRRYQFCVAV